MEQVRSVTEQTCQQSVNTLLRIDINLQINYSRVAIIDLILKSNELNHAYEIS